MIDTTAVTWAIEDGRGFARGLADELLLAGQEVVWVPSRLTVAHRKLHAATGAKPDVIDAITAAHAAITTPSLSRRQIDERVREFRVLSDYRCDLVKRRTTLINQIKAHALLWLDYTPGDLARAKTISLLSARLDATSISVHVRHVHTEKITEMLKKLVVLLASNLLQITGISHISAAVLVTEIGDKPGFPLSQTRPPHRLRPDPGLLIRPRTASPPPRGKPPPE